MWGHVKEDGKGTGKVFQESWSKVRLLVPGRRYRGRTRSEGDVQANAETVYAASSAWREVASGGSVPATLRQTVGLCWCPLRGPGEAGSIREVSPGTPGQPPR